MPRSRWGVYSFNAAADAICQNSIAPVNSKSSLHTITTRSVASIATHDHRSCAQRPLLVSVLLCGDNSCPALSKLANHQVIVHEDHGVACGVTPYTV